MDYLLLGIAGLAGSIAVIPYALTINPLPDSLPIPVPLALALSVLQASVLVAVAVVVGRLAATSVGLVLGFSGLGSDGNLWTAIALGLGSGAAVVALDRWVFSRFVPTRLTSAGRHVPLWKRALAILYGGITEEILMRLFLVSSLAWGLQRVSAMFGGVTSAAPGVGLVYTVAVSVAAIIFGLGHLPATARILPITPAVVARALVLNGIVGLVCGLCYVVFGLAYAIAGHLAADIVLHMIAPLLPSPHAAPITTEGTT